MRCLAWSLRDEEQRGTTFFLLTDNHLAIGTRADREDDGSIPRIWWSTRRSNVTHVLHRYAIREVERLEREGDVMKQPPVALVLYVDPAAMFEPVVHVRTESNELDWLYVRVTTRGRG